MREDNRATFMAIDGWLTRIRPDHASPLGLLVIAFWIGLPLELRFALVAVVGLAAGALANYVIYTFAYLNPRPISPWGPLPEKGPERMISDRIPVVGWLGLRRESSLHGPGFWIRPMLIELAMAIALPALYSFETQTGGLLPEQARIPAFLTLFEPVATQIFFAHTLLVVLMVAATFIDFDEQTIPDIITIPGTLIALIIASMTVFTFMPTSVPAGVLPTTFDSPAFAAAAKWWTGTGWGTGLGIWTVWCFALADRRWSGVVFRRRGLSRAIKHFISGLFHYGTWKVLAAIWVLGLIGISVVWNIGGANWTGLFSSLVGLAVGGGTVWAIRIVATSALQMEAMGFGDVTLMAMIGAFVGWQAATIAFFLSPFAAIVIVLVRYIITRDAYTPFGPYLCAGTMLTILYWDRFYNGSFAGQLQVMGPMFIWLCIAMLGLMAVMLFVWRLIKMAIFRRQP
jgi:leader peptidase (prepilin peptidase)/N-methyltransferase